MSMYIPASLKSILAAEPAFRLKQIYQAWFDPVVGGYGEITALPLELRERLQDAPWLSARQVVLRASAAGDAEKALLELADGARIETVLMRREDKGAKGRGRRYTACLSTQVGCSLGCVFCATGQMGFKRNLSPEEIIDQYRFWQEHLRPAGATVSNIVLMGQGEPLLNYDNVKEALRIILDNTELGQRKITLSTAGLPEAMDKMLADEDFPRVRLAVSLHSALDEDRGGLMPAHRPGFIDFLAGWAKRYHSAVPSRAHFIGLEYMLLDGVNDDDKHLSALISLARRMEGRLRINLIPYNRVGPGASWRPSPEERVKKWHDALMKAGFVATVRLSQGQDIAAACGQLATSSV